MKRLTIILGSLVLASSLVLLLIAYKKPNRDGLFYYAFKEKIMLKTVPGKYVVRYDNEDLAKSSVKQSADKGSFALAEWKDERTALVTMSDTRYTEVKNELNRQGGVASFTPLYATDPYPVNSAVTNEILVRPLKGTTRQQMASLEAQFGLTLVNPNDMFNTYSVRRSDNALLIANAVQETGLVEFSHPNFYMDITKFQVPNDTYFNMQWNLHNTGQVINDGHVGTVDADIDAPEAWLKSQGSNTIIVAVLDEGVTPNHPDLPAARQVVLPGSNFSPGGPVNDPSAVGTGNHGNACAGIIAATRNNAQGVAGVAPNVRIMPIKILNPGATNANIALAIDFARTNGAHVLSNSWGYNNPNPNLVPAITTAIQNATTLGRGGLGCVVVFAAGNTAHQVGGNPGFVSFPGNVNVAGVLTVGASSRFDVQANYSPTSSGAVNNQIIDLVAPSHRAYPNQIAGETFEIWSIDIPPAGTGYNPWPAGMGVTAPPVGEVLPNFGVNNLAYTGRMGGTSAACPEVAGAAALALSVNPGLTQQQVFNIIIETADKVGGVYNAQGFNNQMGNGRLNLERVVSRAGSKLTIKDMAGDNGTEPNPNPTSVYWNSQDIWNCKSGLCGTHANPEVGQVNTIRVRVTNFGTIANMGGGQEILRVYWAKASSALSWPNPWTGGILGCGTQPMGALIGSQNVPVIGPGGSVILNFNWTPPNPVNYACFGSDASHFCLLARIEKYPFPAAGMTFPETTNLWQNVKNNAPIAWRNCTIENVIPRAAQGATVKSRSGVLVAGNKFMEAKYQTVNFHFTVPEEEKDDPILGYANMLFSLGKLYDKWAANGAPGDGIEVVFDQETREPLIKILRPDAVIWKVPIEPDQMTMVVMQTEQFKILYDKERTLNMGMHDEEDEPIGGEAWTITTFTGGEEPPVEGKALVQSQTAEQLQVKVGVNARTLNVFTSNEALRNYELSDLSGNVLKKGTLNRSKQIDASGIPGGMYILNLFDDKRKLQSAKKVMIQ